MIPSLFILLSYLPLSSTGKANRRRIKESASSLSRRDLEQYRGNGTSSSPSCNKRPPLSEMEGSLKKLVVHVLRLDPAEVGMDDHFFHVGGDSLSAMSISAQARRMGLNVKVVDIFSYPQLSDLAAAVTRNANGKGEHAGADDEIPAPFSLVSPAEGLEKETIIQVAVEQCGLEGTQQIDDMYPCTSMQEGLLALTMQQSEAYITKQVLVLSENTDVARFHDAWRAVCEANPILRTRIVSIGADGHLYQVVVRSSSSSTVHGVASASSGDHQSFSVRLGGPLFNIRTISMPQNRYQVVLSLHHSIYDGISMKLILDQLESAYYNREALRLRPYSPFVRYCASGPSESDIAEFWKQELADATTPPFPAVPVHGFVLQAPASVEEDIPFHLDPRASIPVAAALKLAWGIVVSQYTRENDVIFGTIVSGRSAAVQDIDQLSGPTIATVPFRVHYDSTMTVQEALEEVQARTARMIPFEQNGLQRISQLGYEDACRFQNLLLIQTPGVEDAPTSALYQVMQPDDEEDQQRVFDTYPLTIVCTPSPDRVAVRAIFDRGLIDNASMQRLLAQFAHVLTYLNTSVNRQRPLTKMPPVSATDMAKLQTWNGALPPSEDHCIHELVGEMAAARPQAPAICAWDGELLYGRLDRLSSLLANQILAIDSLGPDAIVPVYFEKSKWTAVAALAVMKSGRTFMLLDTGYPLKRLEDICQSIQPVVIISSSHTTSLASSLAPTTITVTDEYANWLEQCDDGENKMKQLSNRKVSSDHPLYVVFTSGSTGKPKGVVNSHRGFCSMSRAHAGIIDFNPDMRSLAFSSYAFDVSISDMFNPLLAGGCVCVPSDADRTENLPEVIARLRVNYVDMTPSLLRTLRPQDLPFVKTVVLGGEALTREIVTTWAPHVHLVNIYGPAECCPSSTVRTGLTPDTDPSDIGIGAGCLCWVVDPADHGRMVPIGAVGELLIEGPIVGCGYLYNPAQTAASFVEPPSWLVPLRPNGYLTNLYKTGDLVHYAPNGSIRFLGRKDNQVKLRGQRIELEEVEHHIRQRLLQQQEGSGGDVVVEVVKPVAPRPAFLAAFLLQDDDCKKADSNNGLLASVPSPRFRHMIPAMESELQNHMPAYMVPAVFIPILRLPLTPTGKTDRRRLREAAAVLPQTQLDEYTPMAAAAAAGGHRMPYTAGEEALQNIWAKVLNRPPQQISVDANFFRLGGDSISAMQLSSQCRAAGYVCKVADIFKYKTIAALTSILESTHLAPGHSNDGKIQGTIKEEGEREARGDPFDLSPIQQTFFDEVPAVLRNHYNQSLILRLSRSLAPTDISRAVEMLVDRHSMLRARFHQAEGRWVQAIIPSSNLVSLSLCYHHHAVSHAEARSIMSNSQQSFDIEHGRVFRTDIIEVDGDGQYIFMVAHHLAIDLVSWRIILDDLEHLLTTDSFSKLSPPSLSFRSWCRLQQDYSQARLSPASVLSAPLPRFNLDYWDLAPEQNTFGVGIDIGFTLDEGITSVLMGSANETFRTSTVDLLHAALLHSFAFTFQDRPAPVFFSEGHGREPWDDSIDLSRTVGWFTTLWPTYVPADAQMSLGDMVRRVKDGRRQVPGNGWAYFASRYLNPEGRRTLAHGQPEIVFNYLGQSQQLESVGALLQPSVSLTKTADMSPDIPRPTIFDISASVTQGRLQMEFSHSRHLPQSSAVEAWVRQCEISLYQVGECLQALPTSFTLCDLPLLSLGSYHDLDHLIDQTLGQVGLAPVDVENIYPCSPVQGGILLAQARDPSRYVTHEVGRVVPSAGNSTVDLDRFKRAWQAVVDRHPILRTVWDHLRDTGIKSCSNR